MVVEQPTQAPKARYEPYAGVVELHLGFWRGFDGKMNTVGDVCTSFCKLDTFKHRDR